MLAVMLPVSFSTISILAPYQLFACVMSPAFLIIKCIYVEHVEMLYTGQLM